MNADHADSHAFPLALAAEGERLRIAAIRTGKGLGRRLRDLGLPLGCEIEVMHRQASGAMVVSQDNARVALGAGMVHKIMVTFADGTGRPAVEG